MALSEQELKVMLEMAIDEERDLWLLGNHALYELCERHRDHSNAKAVAAKIWLIGRSYAAAIERRRKKAGISNDRFYKESVVPALMESELDKQLEQLRTENPADVDILKSHKYLMSVFNDISGLDKRSLASKYLHFHFPNLFYIYDARAAGSLKVLLSKEDLNASPGKKHKDLECDPEYGRFYYGCVAVVKALSEHYPEVLHGRSLTCRQLDRLLIEMANNK